MEATQLFLNDQLVTITADSLTIKKLNEDDKYLAEYVNKATKSGQFNFLFSKDPALRRIVVKRAPTTLKNVWNKKGRPSENDSAANLLLLKLRNCDKYSNRFKDGHSLRTKLWEEIAMEMRMEGFDVTGQKCAQRFLHLTQNCEKGIYGSGEVGNELRKVLGKNESEDDDEEWLPRSNKRRKRMSGDEENDGEFLRRLLKRSSEQKEERFKEVCNLLRRRNELAEEKLKQNRDIITILSRLVK